MYAVGMIRGEPGVHEFEISKPAIKSPDEVLVRVKEVGLDGTDFGIVKQGTPDLAEGRDSMVLGHEMVGEVEEVGSEVKSLAPGDAVVMTVRRGCGICQPCLQHQSDMCMTGLFKERGIHKLDGSMTEYVVDHERYFAKVPRQMVKLAVFTEPLSIVEKGIEQIKVIQSRLPWGCTHPEHSFQSREWGGCKAALVVGAGPLGLLASALLSLARAHTFVADIMPEDSLKARLVEGMGAQYIDARNLAPKEIVDRCCRPTGNLDVIFEASGAAETAVRLFPFMSRSSIAVGTGIPRGDLRIQLDAAELVRQIVRYNQVIVGSVNSNRRHFEMALDDLSDIDSRFDAMLTRMITHRFKLSEYQQAFAPGDAGHIKTIIEVAPWD